MPLSTAYVPPQSLWHCARQLTFSFRMLLINPHSHLDSLIGHTFLTPPYAPFARLDLTSALAAPLNPRRTLRRAQKNSSSHASTLEKKIATQAISHGKLTIMRATAEEDGEKRKEVLKRN